METAKTKPPKSVSRFTLHESASASALILAVVLTSLLAIIGVMFVMIARVDKMATSAISENKELNSAVETVVAKISQELVLDVPGMPKGKKDYYDYPDANNAWLANLEPYEKTAGNYYWRQISDVTGFLNDKGFSTQNVNVKPVGLSTMVYVHDYPVIRVDSDGRFLDDKTGNIATDGVSADADGDGIADSKWVKLDNITSNKGKPIYAAIRIVDNGGMLNVNTARQFDPTSSVKNEIDGSSQMQINLFALAQRGTSNTIEQLDVARYGNEPHDLNDYIRDVVWQYNEPNGRYTPFDISDELELRNRFLLEFEHIDTRIEKEVWTSAFTGKDYLHVPVDGTSSNLNDWFGKAQYDLSEPNATENYSYRHIATTYNMDRIIDPNGVKMTNINSADVNALYNSIRKGLLDTNYPDVNGVAARITVNIIDYRDGDSNVTVYTNNGKTYYGFETQPFISEIAAYIDKTDANKPNKNFYALELYNPFNKAVSLNGFVLSIDNGGTNINTISLNGTIDANGYFVIFNSSGKFTIDPKAGQQPAPTLIFSDNYVDTTNPPDGKFDSWDNYSLTLKRTVGGSDIIILDFQDTNNAWFTPVGNAVYAQRDTSNWHIVYQKMNDVGSAGTLGALNPTSITGKNYNLSLANDKFVTVGDIARVLTVGPSPDLNDRIGAKLAAEPNEESVRLNLQNAAFQQIFNYLTVFDPAVYTWNDPNETRIKGRININTAPWFVLAQLPWMQYEDSNVAPRAKAISDYRDNTLHGFKSIGELMLVDKMWNLGSDNKNNLNTDTPKGPDLTGDTAKDDFEERDVIFARISNLVTVRSDVFTAYLLVRIGTDGPQKRVMAILDRSNVYYDPVGKKEVGKVRIIALHPVPDPR
jgi:DNA uptake protein ComE-like DNA-binding protein